jgi:transcriptional repressor NrdR
MRCPFCAQPSNRVVDSRVSKDGFAIRRRRECEGCGRRFTTYERVEESVPLVVKKDGRRETFDRAKVVSGIKRACEKRPVSADVIDRTVEEIERSLLESGEREVPSSVIGEAVMAALKRIDEVAYVRFASVYRSFKDLNEFMEELKELLRQGEERKGLPK